MFDTLVVAQQPATRLKSSPRRSATVSKQGDHVTSDQFKAGLAQVRTEIANLETRLIRWDGRNGRNRHCYRHVDCWDAYRVGGPSNGFQIRCRSPTELSPETGAIDFVAL